eukprot:TRINITY_DN96172_c0_g1_i1.p1 TRINITY_DN96172_c0_g1~~TRINITY_DN96172_c0_g1_i1.p1  ORF type:complete len:327 (-),score=58.01 TRINITY_DN96172_c0_g1_i1:142-1122(-)
MLRAFVALQATVLSSCLPSAALPLQDSQVKLPIDAWKSAPSASAWDAPPNFLPTLKRPVLLLIDAQENFRGYYGSAMVSEMQLLVEAFRQRCLPIVFKLWNGPPFTEEWRKESTCAPTVPLTEVTPSTESEANRTVKYVEFDHFWKNPHLDDLIESWDVDHVIIAGGFTEHCVIATANAAWSRKIPAIIPALAVGPRNATDGTYNSTRVPSLQHEAALIAMQSSVAQIVPNSSAILQHLEIHDIRGQVCPNATVAAPPPNYMKHAFPKEQEGYCNTAQHPNLNISGIDKDLGAWPLWAPLEAKQAASPKGIVQRASVSMVPQDLVI